MKTEEIKDLFCKFEGIVCEYNGVECSGTSTVVGLCQMG